MEEKSRSDRFYKQSVLIFDDHYSQICCCQRTLHHLSLLPKPSDFSHTAIFILIAHLERFSNPLTMGWDLFFSLQGDFKLTHTRDQSKQRSQQCVLAPFWSLYTFVCE